VEDQSYFNYFTEIEERYQQRRGTALLLSTLDWALIETWKDAGIPLEAALRGIDATFDRYDTRPSKTRKVNSLAYCAQEVLAAAEEWRQAAEGTARSEDRVLQEAGVSFTGDAAASTSTATARDTGFAPVQVAEYLRRNATQLEQPCEWPGSSGVIIAEAARSLREIATGLQQATSARLEDVECRLTVIEEKIFAALLAATPDDDVVAVRAEADRDIAPYRRRMIAAQIEQLHKQYVHKRLLDKHRVPRLSLFYM